MLRNTSDHLSLL